MLFNRSPPPLEKFLEKSLVTYTNHLGVSSLSCKAIVWALSSKKADVLL